MLDNKLVNYIMFFIKYKLKSIVLQKKWFIIVFMWTIDDTTPNSSNMEFPMIQFHMDLLSITKK